MAEKKTTKTTKKKTGNRPTAEGASPKARASAVKEKNKKTSRREAAPEKEKRAESPFLRQAAPYIIALAAVVLAFCVILGEGKIGGGIRSILTGLFAGGAYLLPILLLARALTLHRDREEGKATARSISLVFTFLFVVMFLHAVAGGASTLQVKQHYTAGTELVGGGVFGGVLGELSIMGFGKICTVILSLLGMLFLGLFTAGITPRGLFIRLAYAIKFAGEKRAERMERKRAEEAERRNHPPKNRHQMKEEEYLAYLRDKRKREREQHTAEKAAPSRKRPVGDAVPEATVYRVTRRRMTNLDIPVDDVTVPEGNPPAEESVPAVETEAAPSAADVQREMQDTAVDREAVDEKIFDEVMRRTRERIEKSRRTDDLRTDETPRAAVPEMPAVREPVPQAGGRPSVPDTAHDFEGGENEEIRAGDVLDAVEMAALEVRGRAQAGTYGTPEDDFLPEHPGTAVSGMAAAEDADALLIADDLAITDGLAVTDGLDSTDDLPATDGLPEAAEETEEAQDAEETEPDFAGLMKPAPAETGEDPFDVTKIFVNPADAQLLDKLSENRRTLDVQRSTVSAPRPEQIKPQTPSVPPYQFPPIEILAEDPGVTDDNIKEELQENAVKLVDTLRSFNVKTKIENISRGPTITRYELLPEPGTRVRSIVNLVDDIALNLATMGVRIEAPIPGKSAVGIEVPNKKQSTVHLRTLLDDDRFQDAKSPLTVALGEDVAGEAMYFDIAKMPHLLIAGATGSGKSVCINSIITSLLYKASPEDVKLILIDPKKVELNIYNGIPHLLVPVVSEPKKAAGSLSWAVGEMERRYGLIEAVGVRDIKAFNKVTKDDPDYEYMPRIVIIIDELADLMMTAPDDVEDSICRIAQKARAAGMHLIIGTQRPSVDVITGLIKANIPSRIAFRTSSQIDSRTIIDVGSAANLIGMGDMLFNPVGALKPRRVQGAYVSESDVEEVVGFIKNVNTAYENRDSDKIVNEIEREAQKCGAASGKKGAAAADGDGDEEDPMLKSAVELAIDSGKISTSLIQRRLSLGYGRAAKIIDRMEQLGYVSAPDGQKPREVLITKSDYMEMRLKDETPFDA